MISDSKPNVGRRLRTFRERQGWSLRALAERCGLSINAISRIERGENSPTVSSLHRLADALNVPITDFFIEKPNKVAIHVKSGMGQRISNNGYIVEQLGAGLPGQQLKPYIITIEPECESASSPVHHPGEEFIHCMAGEIEYCVSDQSFFLKAGDSLLFEANQPHYWRNDSSSPAIVLFVFQAAQDISLARHHHRTG
jgi:transcriptional regulator with XRE-family HTH domain